MIAEDFLAESTQIDLLAVGPSGELVSIRATADDAPAASAQLLVRGLADATWLRRRASDLAKLAQEIELLPNAMPRVILFSPHFDPETISAAQSFARDRIDLHRYRCMKQQGQLTLLIEPVKFGTVDSSVDSNASRIEAEDRLHEIPPKPETRTRPAVPTGLTDPPSPSAFRTGLTDADLQLAPTTEQGSRLG